MATDFVYGLLPDLLLLVLIVVLMLLEMLRADARWARVAFVVVAVAALGDARWTSSMAASPPSSSSARSLVDRVRGARQDACCCCADWAWPSASARHAATSSGCW